MVHPEEDKTQGIRVGQTRDAPVPILPTKLQDPESTQDLGHIGRGCVHGLRAVHTGHSARRGETGQRDAYVPIMSGDRTGRDSACT